MVVMKRENAGVPFGALTAFALLVACSTHNSSPLPAQPQEPSFPTNGSTYSYSGVVWGVFRNPASTPNPIPTRALPAKNVRVTTETSFDGYDGVIDSHYALHDTSQEAKTADYSTWLATAGGFQLANLGSVSSTRSLPGKSPYLESARTVYDQPVIGVEVPFAAGNHWNGAGASHSTLAGTGEAFGKRIAFSDDTIVHQDGSYKRSTLNYPIVFKGHNFESVADVESDGATKVTTIIDGLTSGVATTGAPRRVAGGAYVIAFILSPHIFATTIPDWFPGGALPPSPLVRVTVTDRGATALPPACNVPRSIVTSAEAILRVESRVDPLGVVAGTNETTYYAAGIGAVCDISVMDSTAVFILPPKARPAGSETIHMTMWLTAAAIRSALDRRSNLTGSLSQAGEAMLAFAARYRSDVLRDMRSQLLAPGLPQRNPKVDLRWGQLR
jgi:hypothetical protein